MSSLLNIGKLAKATETPAETFRYYEKIGLLNAPTRTAGGDEPMRRLLMFLTPLNGAMPITLREGR